MATLGGASLAAYSPRAVQRQLRHQRFLRLVPERAAGIRRLQFLQQFFQRRVFADGRQRLAQEFGDDLVGRAGSA